MVIECELMQVSWFYFNAYSDPNEHVLALNG